MTATATDAYVEEERIFLWRIDGFMALTGGDYPAALELALSDADLHAAQSMVDKGCEPATLVAILT